MKYILEIYYQGECIEQREYEELFLAPTEGEQIHVEFQNPHYSEEHGQWWVVKKRRHLLFSGKLQTLMLDCEPDAAKGN